MKWRPSPLLCLWVFVACALSSAAFRLWFPAGLFTGWASVLVWAMVGTFRREDEGGAP